MNHIRVFMVLPYTHRWKNGRGKQRKEDKDRKARGRHKTDFWGSVTTTNDSPVNTYIVNLGVLIGKLTLL